ncbi:MerR family transcriptional regulator [Clostridioides difficile]
MESKFSIGQMAKIHNITIESLRHYDRVGLLKPSYINKNTGYRYYSAKDFIILDLIKQCKSMGLSLDEIKVIIENYTSPESVLDVIGKQKRIIDKKIEELNNIKNNITFLEKRINDSLEEGLDKIFIKEYEERIFIKYDNTNRFTEEFEINLSKILVEVERECTYFNKELGFIISYDNLERYNKIIYKNTMISFTTKMNSKKYEKLLLPKGRYLTLNFDDDYNCTQKYYDIIMKYIIDNNIQVIGDFYEIYVITRVGNDGKEKSLGKIQICIK